jgi:hypothetical protein
VKVKFRERDFGFMVEMLSHFSEDKQLFARLRKLDEKKQRNLFNIRNTIAVKLTELELQTLEVASAKALKWGREAVAEDTLSMRLVDRLFDADEELRDIRKGFKTDDDNGQANSH